MQNLFKLPSPVEILETPTWAEGLRIEIKRDDKIHPVVSGNKARKLYRFITSLHHQRPKHIATMGGNRSNFLHALAYLCHQENIKLSAFIRGHQPSNYAQTLLDLERWHTDLYFVDKPNYQRLREDASYAHSKSAELGAVWLPEGGSNADALTGISLAINELNEEPDSIFVPIGTGCTALGLALGLKQRQWNTKVIGVVVLKGAESIKDDMKALATAADMPWPDNLHLEQAYCGKGFGKQTPQLSQEKHYFENLWNIPLDPVYSVKMCNAFKDYCVKKHPHLGNHVLLWHTGGLQGNQT